MAASLSWLDYAPLSLTLPLRMRMRAQTERSRKHTHSLVVAVVARPSITIPSSLTPKTRALSTSHGPWIGVADSGGGVYSGIPLLAVLVCSGPFPSLVEYWCPRSSSRPLLRQPADGSQRGETELLHENV